MVLAFSEPGYPPRHRGDRVGGGACRRARRWVSTSSGVISSASPAPSSSANVTPSTESQRELADRPPPTAENGMMACRETLERPRTEGGTEGLQRYSPEGALKALTLWMSSSVISSVGPTKTKPLWI